jgi:hypothetical protein
MGHWTAGSGRRSRPSRRQISAVGPPWIGRRHRLGMPARSTGLDDAPADDSRRGTAAVVSVAARTRRPRETLAAAQSVAMFSTTSRPNGPTVRAELPAGAPWPPGQPPIFAVVHVINARPTTRRAGAGSTGGLWLPRPSYEAGDARWHFGARHSLGRAHDHRCGVNRSAPPCEFLALAQRYNDLTIACGRCVADIDQGSEPCIRAG